MLTVCAGWESEGPYRYWRGGEEPSPQGADGGGGRGSGGRWSVGNRRVRGVLALQRGQRRANGRGRDWILWSQEEERWRWGREEAQPPRQPRRGRRVVRVQEEVRSRPGRWWNLWLRQQEVELRPGLASLTCTHIKTYVWIHYCLSLRCRRIWCTWTLLWWPVALWHHLTCTPTCPWSHQKHLKPPLLDLTLQGWSKLLFTIFNRRIFKLTTTRS